MDQLCFTAGFGMRLPSTAGARAGVGSRDAPQFCCERRDPTGTSIARPREEPL